MSKWWAYSNTAFSFFSFVAIFNEDKTIKCIPYYPPPPKKKTKNAERLEKRMFTDLKIPILKLLANKARGIETGNANLHYA